MSGLGRQRGVRRAPLLAIAFALHLGACETATRGIDLPDATGEPQDGGSPSADVARPDVETVRGDAGAVDAEQARDTGAYCPASTPTSTIAPSWRDQPPGSPTLGQVSPAVALSPTGQRGMLVWTCGVGICSNPRGISWAEFNASDAWTVHSDAERLLPGVLVQVVVPAINDCGDAIIVATATTGIYRLTRTGDGWGSPELLPAGSVYSLGLNNQRQGALLLTTGLPPTTAIWTWSSGTWRSTAVPLDFVNFGAATLNETGDFAAVLARGPRVFLATRTHGEWNVPSSEQDAIPTDGIDDYPVLAMNSRGEVLLAYANTHGIRIASRSLDGVWTFPSPASRGLTFNNELNHEIATPQDVALDDHGNGWLLWLSRSDTRRALYLSRLENGRWEHPDFRDSLVVLECEAVAWNWPPPTRPFQVAIAPSGRYSILALREPHGPGCYEVRLSRYANNGSGWIGAVTENAGPASLVAREASAAVTWFSPDIYVSFYR